MWTRIYAVYDKKAEQLLGGLMLVPNDQAATRLFTDSARAAGQGHILYDHIEDFDLLCLGEFNQVSGKIHQKVSDDNPFEDQNNVILTGKRLLEIWSAPTPLAPAEEPPALSLTGL